MTRAEILFYIFFLELNNERVEKLAQKQIKVKQIIDGIGFLSVSGKIFRVTIKE
jgi:hypothetical protein